MDLFAKKINQYIDGQWRKGSSNKIQKVYNPYTSEVIAEVNIASEEDIHAAYQAAKEAQEHWGKVSASKKVSVLEKAYQFFEKHKDDIVETLCKEAGSSFVKANIELEATMNVLKQSMDYPHQLEERSELPALIENKTNYVYRAPIGVAGIISSFNFPLHLSMRSIAVAIATGNSVVHKPDMQTALSGGVIIAKAFEDAGLPKGVFNLILTNTKEIGDSFIEHPIPKIISFTGSTGVGRHIGSIAGKNLKRTALELGGNNPFIVLEDADIDQAINAAIFGKFLHQGQICMIINRILVHRNLYDTFIEKYTARAASLKCGNPVDPSVVIGPLINEKQADHVMSIIEEGKNEGAKLVLEGKREGNLITPFVFADVNNDMNIARSEIFGPVVSIIPFDNEEEAIHIANDSEYGLSAGIFTENIEKGITLARRIESGMAHVNDQSVNDDSLAPFGGEKASGIGRFGGQWALEEFTRVQWVSVQNQPRKYPF
ncbi:aldehyde dehydrogenase [Bacillus australimaris]|uniref:Aldehyde dehydrogenase n=1 Tax=Bacillus australimaris TaxID=1326968 RepID=A0ABD4QMT8_9BACI|nr:aldehyde dehydrogenase family protein [Bacillus australimaris]KPN14179.1 aldehyde dehydrogenase [Bacillus australimaris]MBR8690380.1 aldehyde dehydrogenase family protein [Bacillus australimaris]